LFYSDIIVGGRCYSNLSVKFLLRIVYMLQRGYSVDYSGLRSRQKNDTAPAPELFLQLRLLVVFTH